MKTCEYIDLETGRVCGRPAEELAVVTAEGWVRLCTERHADITGPVFNRILEEKLLLEELAEERARNVEAALGRVTRIVEVDYRPGKLPLKGRYRLIYDERFWGDFQKDSPVLVSVRGIN